MISQAGDVDRLHWRWEDETKGLVVVVVAGGLGVQEMTSGLEMELRDELYLHSVAFPVP
jgi:hypothetical protein